MSKSAERRVSRPVKAKSQSASKSVQRRTGRSVSKSKSATSSKQDRVIALLRSPCGVSIAAMAKATGWQPHSVRGFLAGVVRKKLRLNLDSSSSNGRRTYRIVDNPASA
jgi:hypothetical protein